MQSDRFRVLVADDHDGIRDCLVGILNRDFRVVSAVSNGHALVDAAIELEPDVIVSDVRMPGLSGTAALRILEDAGVHIPFVFVTGDKYLAEHVGRNFGVCVAKTDAASELVPAVEGAVVMSLAAA